ncbi:MAG: alpha/beta hydrolase, partial [Spirochaetales bacterium]
EGSGTPIVLINGGPGDTHHCFHPWFSEIADAFTVVYYDQRGCGSSDYIPGNGYTFDQAVDDLDRLREALGYDAWIVLGFSYGGAVAQYYTIRHPERVLGLALVAAEPLMSLLPSVDRGTEVFSDDELKAFKEHKDGFTAGKMDYNTMFYNLLAAGFWKRGNYRSLSPERMAQAARHDMRFDPEFTSDYNTFRFDGVFESCPVPTLLAEGRYDIIWADGKAEAFAKNHRNAVLARFEKSRHYIFQDEPEEFMKTLRTWARAIIPAATEEVAEWKEAARSLVKKA